MSATVNTVVTCSRLVVRAFLNGVYNSSPPLDQGSSVAACSTSAFPNVKGSKIIAKNSSSEGFQLTSPPKFLSAKCGFPKDMIHGPSTALEQEVYGDDACFIASHRSADVVGVADGVGGWRSYGIDPSEFARGLMKICADLVRSGQFRPHLPAQLLASAYQKLHFESANLANKESRPLIGSSTACVVVLDKLNSIVHTANLGDSGFLVFREDKVVHRSEEQCHYFNTPFQLSLPPNEGRHFLSDSPESAETASFVVRDGDIILVATDGLFDNLSTDLIEKELQQMKDRRDEAALQGLCNSLALQARHLAFDEQYMSPFAKKAQSYGIHAPGGKPDDITVLLAVVTAENDASVTGSGVNEMRKNDVIEEEMENLTIDEMDLPSRDLMKKKK